MSALKDTAPEWNGVPEIVASGSPWEIGYTHGSQIPQRIRLCIENYRRLFLETAEADWPESKARSAAYLPSLEKNEPDLVEEIKGIAAGAGLDFLDILALNLRSEISLTNYSDGCTSLVSRNAARDEVFVAQNWDWIPEAGQTTAFFDIRKENKPRIRMFGEAGLVGKFGLNDAGVGINMNAIRCATVAKNQLPVHIAMRRVLECRSFDEALALLSRKGLATCVNIALGDAKGNIAMLECTPKGLAPIFPEPGTSTTFHTNHLWSPNIPDGIRDHASSNSFHRLARIKDLCHAKEASVASIRSWLSDTEGTPGSVCRSAPPGSKGTERLETLATVIIDLKNLRMELSLGKPDTSPPVRVMSMD